MNPTTYKFNRLIQTKGEHLDMLKKYPDMPRKVREFHEGKVKEVDKELDKIIGDSAVIEGGLDV